MFPSRAPSQSWYVQVTTALSNIEHKLNNLTGKVAQILMSQQQIEADVAAISAMMDAVSSDTAQLVSDTNALRDQVAAGTPVDTSQLDALAARAQGVQSALDAATQGVSGLVTPPAPADAPADVPPADISGQ
jgi:septal ring factor EnvC (AmiA/AmiB activator)